MRVLFLGTPTFALPTLRSLANVHAIVGVFTRPDRRTGRGRDILPSPVKREATRLELPVLQPDPFNDEGTYRRARELRPDVAVVVAYGFLLSPVFLDIPRLGCVNLHASLLPAYRGAAPIQWAVTRGETRTGVTTMQMDAGMDTGDILLQRSVEIGPDDSAADVAERLGQMGGPLMLETLAGLERGTLKGRPQPSRGASRAPKLRREDGRVDWGWGATRIVNLVRGMQPWPVAHTRARGKWLRVFGAATAPAPEPLPRPGTVIGPAGRTALIACGEGSALALREVQPESRRRMSGLEAINGRVLCAGDVLG